MNAHVIQALQHRKKKLLNHLSYGEIPTTVYNIMVEQVERLLGIEFINSITFDNNKVT